MPSRSLRAGFDFRDASVDALEGFAKILCLTLQDLDFIT